MRGEGDIFMWRVDEEFRTCNFELVRSSDCRRGTHVASGYLGLVWLLESNFQDFVRGSIVPYLINIKWNRYKLKETEN